MKTCNGCQKIHDIDCYIDGDNKFCEDCEEELRILAHEFRTGETYE